MVQPSPDIATRLCGACGLCCNGVLFHNVRLQPDDAAQDLVQRGLHIKRKKTGSFFLQPCPAYRDSACSIYLARPTRCRLFECRQLQGVISGDIAELDAMQRIGDAKNQVEIVIDLLNQAGKTDPDRPLSKRYEKIIAEPPFEPEMVALHAELTSQMTQLEEILEQNFRVAATPTPLKPD